jgi:hypothetical protein
MLCYGADSDLGHLDQGPVTGEEQFLVCKVAANDCQRRFIVEAFEILRCLGSNAVPAVQVHPERMQDVNRMLDGRGTNRVDESPTAIPKAR